jgi:uncharacterized membrane protein YccC
MAASFPHQGVFALRFAVNVFVGSAIVWHTLLYLDVSNPIWAVAAMIAAVDPKVEVAARMFRSRIINVFVGCVVGLIFLTFGRSEDWMLSTALAATVLVSSYLIRIQTMWRQAPITAALVIASGLTSHSKLSGMELGLRKVVEVLFGCVVGLLVSWLMARVWPLAETAQADDGS